MRSALWVIIGFVIIASCTSNNQESLNHISKIRKQLDSAASNYNLDSNYLARVRKDVKIRSRMSFDSNSVELRKARISFGNIDRRLKQSLKMDKVIHADLTKSEKQLNDLYHDIDNNILKEDEFKKYIDEEQEIAKSIIERMQYNQSRVNLEIAKYDSLKTILEKHVK